MKSDPCAPRIEGFGRQPAHMLSLADHPRVVDLHLGEEEGEWMDATRYGGANACTDVFDER